MAPLRSSAGRNRGTRAQNDDVLLDGLPVRQWRKRNVFVDQDAIAEDDGRRGGVEDKWTRPLALPKGSEYYPDHSIALLKAARAGRFKAPTRISAAHDDDDEEDGEATKEKAEPGEKERRGFHVEKWMRISKEKEEPEPEYLAPRRPGLPPLYISLPDAVEQAVPGPVQGPMRKAKIRKVDANGVATIWEVYVQEGQTVEGEVAEEAVSEEVKAAPAEAAPGTVVEGVGVVNTEGVLVAGEVVATPPRRKPPIPRKKHKKGPGRGRKKVMFTEGGEGQMDGTSTPQPGQDAAQGQHLDTPAKTDEGGDTPMADAHDDDDDDNDDDDEEGDEDGQDENQDRESTKEPEAKQETPQTAGEPTIKIEPAPPQDDNAMDTDPPQQLPDPVDLDTAGDATMLEPPADTIGRDPSSSPELPLSAGASHSHTTSQTEVPTVAVADTTAEETQPEYEDGDNANAEVPASIEPVVVENPPQEVPLQEAPLSVQEDTDVVSSADIPPQDPPLDPTPIEEDPITSEPPKVDAALADDNTNMVEEHPVEEVSNQPENTVEPPTLEEKPSEDEPADIPTQPPPEEPNREPTPPPAPLEEPPVVEPEPVPVPSEEKPVDPEPTPVAASPPKAPENEVSEAVEQLAKPPEDEEPKTDLLGSLEAHLDKQTSE